MRDYGYENLQHLNDPKYIGVTENAYRLERRAMASHLGHLFIEQDPENLNAKWQIQSYFEDRRNGDSYNSTLTEYFNIGQKPITVSTHDGVDIFVRHANSDDFINQDFINKYRNGFWFVIQRTDRIDLTAFLYKLPLEEGFCHDEHLQRLHHFLMRNYVNQPISTPFRQAMLDHIRDMIHKRQVTGEFLVIKSYMVVRTDQFKEGVPNYIFDADMTLTQGVYIPVDDGVGERIFELKKTMGLYDHPTSALALRRGSDGVLSAHHRGSAGMAVRCRLSRTVNQENCIYLIQGNEVISLPNVKPAPGEKEGIYLSTVDAHTGAMTTEIYDPADPVLRDKGIYIHQFEADGKASEIRNKQFTEVELKQKLAEQEEKARLAQELAEKEAEQRAEQAKAKAKAQEDAARNDALRLVAGIIGAISTVVIAIAGLIKLFSPSKSSISGFLKFS